MKHIGIVGTRKRKSGKDFLAVEKAFLKLYKAGDWIVTGGCPEGGDEFARKLGKKYGVPVLTFWPNWKRYGRGAGIVRNTPIAKHSDRLIACVSEERKGGTEDTIEKFLRRCSCSSTTNLVLV